MEHVQVGQHVSALLKPNLSVSFVFASFHKNSDQHFSEVTTMTISFALFVDIASAASVYFAWFGLVMAMLLVGLFIRPIRRAYCVCIGLVLGFYMGLNPRYKCEHLWYWFELLEKQIEETKPA